MNIRFNADDTRCLIRTKSRLDYANSLKLSRSVNSVSSCLLEYEPGDRDPSNYKRLSIQACNILNDLRSNNQLCDAVIRVADGTEFPIHRAVLSGNLILIIP